MDIINEEIKRTQELMGILNEQKVHPQKDRCVDLWHKWSDMVDQLIKRKTNSVGDEELKEAKQVCWCMNKYDEFQRNRFTEKMKNVLVNLGLGECIGMEDSRELEEIVVYDETQEQVDGEGIQGLDEDAGRDTPGGNPDYFYSDDSLIGKLGKDPDYIEKLNAKSQDSEMSKEDVIQELVAIYSYSQDGATDLVHSTLENLLYKLGGFK